MRTILYGDYGNLMDIEANARAIDRVRSRRERDLDDHQDQKMVIRALREELGRQKLAIAALTRFLVRKGVVSEEEFDEFIAAVDAEDGEVDGKIPVEVDGRLQLQDGGFRLGEEYDTRGEG